MREEKEREVVLVLYREIERVCVRDREKENGRETKKDKEIKVLR